MAVRLHQDEPNVASDYVNQILVLQGIVVAAYPEQGTDESRLNYLIAQLLDNWGGGSGTTGYWGLKGNTGTVDGTNWIGTNDDVPWNIKVNGLKSGRIGRVDQNTMFGYQTSSSIAAGIRNAHFGYNAGKAVAAGVQNAIFGSEAASQSDVGGAAAFGYVALFQTTGNSCTGLGWEAGYPNTTGYNNVYVGGQSGYDPVNAANNNATGYYNVCIGYRSLVGGNLNSVLSLCGIGNASNQIVIGGAVDSYTGTEAHYTMMRIIYSAAGAEHDEYYRTSTPEGAQAGTRGDIVYVNDGALGKAYLKTSGAATNTGYDQLVTLAATQTLDAKTLTNVAALAMTAGRMQQAKGADVAAANDLTLGSDGNVFKITGNTTVNAITISQWQAGSQLILWFTGTPTVKHNTAGGAGTAKIFLNASSDFVAANHSILKLMYDGTQWQEVSRKVA